MLLLFTKFPVVIALTISLIIGLAVGYADWISNYLSLSRTFVFFPLFLLGYYLEKSHLHFLFKPTTRVIALLVFISVYIDFTYFRT